MKIIMILIGLCCLSDAAEVSKKYKTVHVRSALATAGLALAGIKTELKSEGKDRPLTPPPTKELSTKYLQRRARLMEPLPSTLPLKYSSRSPLAAKDTLASRSAAKTE